MPIADTIAIFFVEPLLLTLLSALLLKEHIGWRRIAAVLIGFCGALLVIQPKFHEAGLVVLYPLGAALAFSLYMILTRIMAANVNPLVMQFMAGIFGFLTMSIGLAIGTFLGIAALTFAWPSSSSWGLLALLGVIATLTHILVVLAVKFAPASVVAPFQYLEIISATLLGYIFFSDFPTPMTWLGITIIVASGIYVIYREHVIARRENARPVIVAPPPPIVAAPSRTRA
ncbi:MAG: EamA family transporter [Rhizobiales bacterium]|nr:EamA family transporter [Hyphomicrobiales bacterium]